jgi:hypothetical protein
VFKLGIAGIRVGTWTVAECLLARRKRIPAGLIAAPQQSGVFEIHNYEFW